MSDKLQNTVQVLRSSRLQVAQYLTEDPLELISTLNSLFQNDMDDGIAICVDFT
jgi:hypothetical protein